MTRKDIIIITMLINTGILAALFMLAINTDDPLIKHQAEMTEMNSSLMTPKNDFEGNGIDANFLEKTSGYTIEELDPPILVDEGEMIELEKNAVYHPATLAEEKTLAEIHYAEVTVKRGDAMEKIARSNGTTIEAIKKANNLSTTKLSIGQVLRVPVNTKTVSNSPHAASSINAASQTNAPSKEKPIAASSNSSYQSAQPQYYTIKKGDNPWKIAKEFHVKFDELLRLNDLDEERARNLKIGEKIRVR